MKEADNAPYHNFADRTLRDALHDPENLRDLVEVTAPEVATILDFSTAHYLDRTALQSDLSEREADIVCRVRTKTDSHDTLLCILVEHQTDRDPRMPLRMLEYAVQVWQQATTDSPDQPLPGILPIVLHTGQTRWLTNRQLDELFEHDADLELFPRWHFRYLSLADNDARDLATAPQHFLNCLAIVCAERWTDIVPLQNVVRLLTRSIARLATPNIQRYWRLLEFTLRWIHARVSKEVSPSLLHPTLEGIRYDHQERIMTISNDLGLSWEETSILSHKRGVEQGIEQGLNSNRQCLLSLLHQRFAELPVDLVEKIEACNDLEILGLATRRILEISSPEELDF